MIKIAILSYRELTGLIRGLRYEPPADVRITIVDALMEEAFRQAKKLEEDGLTDVFISAGGNAAFLQNRVKAPLIEISATGVDVLQALTKVKAHTTAVSDTIAIVNYMKPLDYVTRIAPVLNIKVRQMVYSDMHEMPSIMDRLERENILAVVGGSLTLEYARNRGIHAEFLYSEDGVLRALKEAVQLGRAIDSEAAKAERLRMILQYAHEGILSTDQDGRINEFNDSAERITGIARKDAMGMLFQELFSSMGLEKLKTSLRPDLSQMHTVGKTRVLANCVPIVTKEVVDGMIATFQDVTEVQKAEQSIRERLHKKGFVAKAHFSEIVGKSEIMLRVKERAAIYARSDSTIVIEGASGTGKELFAQAIHNASRRCARPFVAINCAALPEALLESELFGYAEGAFTGAKKGGKAGLFELAHGGSIFLDEIGEMQKSIQSRLLRVLQEHEVLRVGGERIIPVDIRVIAATNKNLWEMVGSGLFREDLYYRLVVLEVRLPALCQRPEDIPPLVAQFLAEFRPEFSQRQIARIAQHSALLQYSWPGNIRELRNVTERIAILYQEDRLDEIVETILGITELSEVDGERQKIQQLLATCRGNKTEVAKNLGISRVTLWRKLKMYFPDGF